MTPPATAPDARGNATKTRTAGHRATLRKPVVPRRVSGPAGGVAAPRPAVVPSRRVRRPRRRAATPSAGASLSARAGAFVAALADHPLLDRIVRGRAWIPILGILLAGIVAMQVEVLKLSASVGRSIERSTALQSRNEQLHASVSALNDEQRIEQLAAGMGMVMPDPTTVDFLTVRPGLTVRQALNNINQPDASAFIASLAAADSLGASAPAAGGAAPATAPAAGGTSATAPAAGGTSATAPAAGSAPATATPTQQTPSSGAASTSTGG